MPRDPGFTVAETGKVFISYARKDAQGAARWLRDQLRARGYEPWMDESEIVGGDEWQSQIIRAVDQSAAFIALISEQSVRPGSVCYPEIELALTSRAGIRVVPVVVRHLGEDLKGRPLRLLPLHQLDLADFEQLTESERDAGFAQILSALEGREAGDNALERVRERFPKIDFEWLFFGYRRRFHGRDWLFRVLDGWSASGPEPAMLLVAPPGVGKTASMIRWVTEHVGLGAYHFCRSESQVTRDARSFVASVVHQMLAIPVDELRDYRGHVIRQVQRASSAQFAIDDPGVLFEDLVLRPLRGLADGRTWVLAVDGMDEAGEDIRRLLADALPTFPPSVRLLMTARAGSGAESSFEPHLLRLKSIDPGSPENLADLQDFVRSRLDSSPRRQELGSADVERVCSALLKSAEGHFAHAEFNLNEFDAGRISAVSLAESSAGNEASFLRAMERSLPASQQAAREQALQSVSVVLASPRPLGDKEIAEILCRTERSVFSDFERLQACFPVSRDGTRLPFHRSFVEWLVAPARPHAFQVSRSEGVGLIRKWLERGPQYLLHEFVGQDLLAGGGVRSAERSVPEFVAAAQAALSDPDVPWKFWLGLVSSLGVAMRQSGGSAVVRDGFASVVRAALEAPCADPADALPLADALSQADRMLREDLFLMGTSCAVKLRHWQVRANAVDWGRMARVSDWARGKLQLTMLVRHAMPGHDVRGLVRDPFAAHAETMQAIRRLHASGGGWIHDAVFVHGSAVAVVDVLRVDMDELRALKILNKKIDGCDGADFTTARGSVRSDWKPYIARLAFQVEVAARALSSEGVHPNLVRPGIIGISPAASPYEWDSADNFETDARSVRSRSISQGSVRWKRLPPAGWRSPRIAVSSAADAVASLQMDWTWMSSAHFRGFDVSGLVDRGSLVLRSDHPVDAQTERGWKCGSCEFRAAAPSQGSSGFDHCWGQDASTAKAVLGVNGLGRVGLSLQSMVELLRDSGHRPVMDLPPDRVPPRLWAQSLADSNDRPMCSRDLQDCRDHLRRAAHDASALHVLHIDGVSWNSIPAGGHHLSPPGQFSSCSLSVRHTIIDFANVVQSSVQYLHAGTQAADEGHTRHLVDDLRQVFGNGKSPILHWGLGVPSALRQCEQRIRASADGPADEERLVFLAALLGERDRPSGRLLDLMRVFRDHVVFPGQEGRHALRRVVSHVCAWDSTWNVLQRLLPALAGSAGCGGPGERGGDAKTRDPFRSLPPIEHVLWLGSGAGLLSSLEEARAGMWPSIEDPTIVMDSVDGPAAQAKAPIDAGDDRVTDPSNDGLDAKALAFQLLRSQTMEPLQPAQRTAMETALADDGRLRAACLVGLTQWLLEESEGLQVME